MKVNMMKIKHYLYNTFIIESGDVKIAIDPGALFFYHFRTTTLIPKSEWNNITHIFVTHGDPDHHWHTDRVADASNDETKTKYIELCKNYERAVERAQGAEPGSVD